MKQCLFPPGKYLAAATAALLAAAALAAPASADNGAQKVNFFELPIPGCQGNFGGAPTESFAIIKRDGNDTLSAEVSLKNARPDTTYTVELVQSGCSSFTATTLTTNDQGNGNAHVSAPQVANDASVFIVSPNDEEQTPEVFFDS